MSYVLSLKGRNALITGASSGLGEYFANALARAGATVALAARRQESLERVRKNIEAQGHSAVAVAMQACLKQDGLMESPQTKSLHRDIFAGEPP